ncbi:gluconate 2-dehydrogenase subunit 3 family protein [Mesorhizobium sp. M0166]|uniref:gluconate 2-dehydrogenase subunit 3 family protein n=1 Tax=Mesorhizobium sp. M0166 TaxID=2956902 RepID=UPI003337AC64
MNDVTFVYPAFEDPPQSVEVIGSFAPLYQRLPLRRVRFLNENTAFFAITVSVPRREAFSYKFVVDGNAVLDSVNPQVVRADNGQAWSRFFTWEHSQPLFFESFEMALVQRLSNHILPFRTREGQRFLSWYYNGLDNEARRGVQRRAYRFDDSAGAAIYIDHILAREEAHRGIDYKICLQQIARILRTRDPEHEPADVSKDLFEQLYGEFASGTVVGWDVSTYQDPTNFLKLVRRHVFTGAFSHPKYGGNAALAGWSYLDKELAPDPNGSIFNWRRSLEKPLGTSSSYLG